MQQTKTNARRTVPGILAFLALILLPGTLAAQYHIAGDNQEPVKLSTVIENYVREQEALDEGGIASGRVVREGPNYHFDRWLWYWQSQTDLDGNMVSRAKTMDEWKKFRAAQARMKTTAGPGADWTFMGPSTSSGGYAGIGRINEIRFHPTDPDWYWVCTAGGGLWETRDNGQTWTSLTEDLPILGTSDLVVNPLNPQTLYLLTGDRDASDTYSLGVLKSTDGGGTWNPTGLNWAPSQLRLTNSMVMNPLDTLSLSLATSEGLYQSYDGGDNWSLRINGNFKQILYHPLDTLILYATTYGVQQAHVYRSVDGGLNWTPSSLMNKRRILLAVTPSVPDKVMAVAVGTNGGLDGIYTSHDAGLQFSKVYGPVGCAGDLISSHNAHRPNSCGNQGWYDLTIEINPSNPAQVIVGGVNSHYSLDSGITWTLANQWWAQLPGVAAVHADKHCHRFHPLVPNRLFECNDGGVYYTDNFTSQIWLDRTNGMGITQFYRNAVAPNSGPVITGAQDNGSKGYFGGVWQDLSGGDGMDCQVDYSDSTIFYTSHQYGNFYRYVNGVFDEMISDNIAGKPSQGAWITPLIISPHNPAHLLVGYKKVYFSPNRGSQWVEVSTRNLDGENRNISRLAMTLASDSTLYAVIDRTNKIFYTHSFVPGTPVVFDSVVAPINKSISDILVDPKDKHRLYVSFSGFGGIKVAVWDNGTWSSLNQGLPDVPAHCLALDTTNGTLYLGTNIGVFYRNDTTPQWNPYQTNLPSIEVTDLAIQYNTEEIWATTYGRGLWKSPKLGAVVDTATQDSTDRVISVVPYHQQDFFIMPNPSSGDFNVATTNRDWIGQRLSAQLVDMQGAGSWSGEVLMDGRGQGRVSVPRLSEGIYTLILYQDRQILGRLRLIIQKGK